MKNSVKRLLALATASAMLVGSLSACGSSSTDSTDDTTSSGASSGSSTTSETGDTGDSSATGAVAASEINIDTSEDAIQDLVLYETTAREVESLNVLYSQSATDFYVSTNLQDGLLTNDEYGNLKANLAESWEHNEDSTVWTFYLRQDAYWVDANGEVMGQITAEDFVTGLEWVLNAYKNEASNTSMPIEMIEGASEYYEMTAAMTEEEALALTTEDFLEVVGISTPDEYTVEYTMLASKPYFDTVATYACLYPAPTALLNQLTEESDIATAVETFRTSSYTDMWYSGPYILTYFVSKSEKVFEPNPYWWGNDEYTRFNSVTVKMVDSADVAYTLYESGDIDQVDLTESNLTTIYNAGEGSTWYDYLTEKLPTKYSYQIHFCYNKNTEDGEPDVNWNTAVANENFRLALYYGLDLSNWYKRTNAINPLKCENNCYTMSGLIYTSDGTDYTTLVKDLLGLGDYDGESVVRLDSSLAEQYKEAAMEELSALGVTFPVEIDYYISSASSTAQDSADVLKDAISDSLGDDFVVLNIKTYTSSLSTEVRTPKLASIYINGWGADYGDPQNYLGQETFGNDNAYYSAVYSDINDFYGEDGEEPYSEELIATYEEYTALVEAADAIVDDLDARYEAYAEAEAYLIQHALVIPCYYDISWQLTCVNDYSKINAPYGIQNNRYLNWETNKNGYTTADYEEFAAAYESGNTAE
ncbi:MAG: ABC transporter substrate-binding protein [Clostridiales bacterium]|nr:ABC transporter substrate-binding protein [Clostridiales bacterium]